MKVGCISVSISAICGIDMNKSSVEAGLELVKEIGVISDWEHDWVNQRYILVKRTWDKNKTHPDMARAFLDETDIAKFSLPTDVSDAVTEIFNSQAKAEKKANIKYMIEGKLMKLLDRMELRHNDITAFADKGLLGTEIGWVRVRLKLMEEGQRLTKKDILQANELWKKYDRQLHSNYFT